MEFLYYDIIIATRNRCEALELSIPLILKQSLQPSKMIVVDSSDDHNKINEVITQLTVDAKFKVEIYNSKPGLTLQRNIGLEHVQSPITIFPDDDSLWYPDVAEAIIEIYDADKANHIGGVTGKETLKSPISSNKLNYKKSWKDSLKGKVGHSRTRFEAKYFPKPFDLFAYEHWNNSPPPQWLSDYNARPVETMGGFRMSFRTDVIKSVGGFDEALGSVVGYSQHEDMEASIAVQRKGYALVGAHNARVFHHRFPSKRTNGFAYGFCQIYNYIYICCKHLNRKSKAWKYLPRYMKYKIFLYSLDKSPYGKDRYKGAKAAWKSRQYLMNSNPDDLANNYHNSCKSSIETQQKI